MSTSKIRTNVQTFDEVRQSLNKIIVKIEEVEGSAGGNHNIISATHTDSELDGSLVDKDILGYRDSKWKNSSPDELNLCKHTLAAHESGEIPYWASGSNNTLSASKVRWDDVGNTFRVYNASESNYISMDATSGDIDIAADTLRLGQFSSELILDYATWPGTNTDGYLKNTSGTLTWESISGSGVPSQVFLTGVTGAGVISAIGYEADTAPSNKVITSFTSDNDSITLNVDIHVNDDDWQPGWVRASGGGATTVTVNKENWTWVEGRDFTASITLTDADTSGTITIELEDGDSETVTYTRSANPPAVQTLVWDDQGTNADPYPGIQTQFGQGQTMKISGTTDIDADEIYIEDFESTNGEGLQGPFAVSGTSFGPLDVTSGNSSGSLRIRAYAKVTGGSDGDSLTSTATTEHSQTTPSLSITQITYPPSQEALKDSENARIQVADSNHDSGDTVTWSDPQGEFDDGGTMAIADTEAEVDAGTYTPTTWNGGDKWVERQSGDYRDDSMSHNVLLTKIRAEKNGLQDTLEITIEIAHVLAELTISRDLSGNPLLRLGTDDGTNNRRDHSIYIVSNQRRLSTLMPSVAKDPVDASAFQGSWAEVGTGANDQKIFRRTLRVFDNSIKPGGQTEGNGTTGNNHTWDSPSFTNRAGKETTTITTYPTYQLGGFQERSLTIAAWPNREGNIEVNVVQTGKLVCENTSKGGTGPNGGTIFTFDNSPGSGTPDNELDKFCITDGADAVDDDGEYFYNKDQPNAQSNSQGTAIVLIREDP